METAQNIIILILVLWIIILYGNQKHVKYWKEYYKKESETHLYDYEELYFEYNIIEKNNKEILDITFELEEKLNKAEEIISQQKQELTRKQSKKK